MKFKRSGFQVPPSAPSPQETPIDAHMDSRWELQTGQSGRRADARTGLLEAVAPAVELGTGTR